MIARVVISLALAGATPGKDSKDFVIDDGAVVVFLGDTVTLERTRNGFRPKYPSFVESYVRARYPSRKVEFYNRAVEDDTASLGEARLERDVLPLKPTAAVVCFGMSEARQATESRSTLEGFVYKMNAITRRLTKTGCRVWLLTPSCADEERNTAARRSNVNARLEEYVEGLKKVASDQKVSLINWYAASAAALKEQRQINPNFRLSDDGVEPSPVGHSLAATEILKAWCAQPYDYTITVDFAARSVQSPVGRVVVAQNSPPGQMEITLRDIPLFWPLSAGRACQADASWPVNGMNRLLLKVRNAPETGMLMRQGRREVPVLPFQLTEGINLALASGFREVSPAADLLGRILAKNNVRAQVWIEQSNNRPEEPELQAPFDRFVEVLEMYADGYQKIIDRIPRQFDETLVLRDIMAEVPEETPKGRNPSAETNPAPSERK